MESHILVKEVNLDDNSFEEFALKLQNTKKIWNYVQLETIGTSFKYLTISPLELESLINGEMISYSLGDNGFELTLCNNEDKLQWLLIK